MYFHTLQHCWSITLSKNVIQGSELKVNKIRVGHLGKYQPFSKSVLCPQSCVIYRTKSIPMPYNIVVALPYRKMWSKGVSWRKTKYASAIFENIRHFQFTNHFDTALPYRKSITGGRKTWTYLNLWPLRHPSAPRQLINQFFPLVSVSRSIKGL